MTSRFAGCGAGVAHEIIPGFARSTRKPKSQSSCDQDHSRVRGKHALPCTNGSGDLGSSPRSRGALGTEHRLGSGRGIIPAFAGSTPAHPAGTRRSPDHPRVRGEHAYARVANRCRSGSSPRSRGAPDRLGLEECRTGIIPAFAGAPLGRGATPDYVRIIPAFAGSTHDNCANADSYEDHPRVRGEHASVDASQQLTTGSSPRSRGARQPGVTRDDPVRIIPAFAGSTWTTTGLRLVWRDHPRVRGEHHTRVVRRPAGFGSSPRSRGAHCRAHLQYGDQRIIPAFAGSTGHEAYRPDAAADHPRVRGEHFAIPINDN